jgi:hypothetical protein
MKSFVLGFAVLLLSVAGTAFGQHADIRPYVADGRILTAGFNDATSTEVLDMRVFGYDFGEDPGQPFFAQDPGFNAAAGSGLAAGSQLLFNIVGAGGLGLAANLSFWDGSGDVDFAVAPAGETLTLNFGSQNRVADDSTDFVAGFNLQTVTASGAIHRHLNAFLNGGSGDPTAGIYLLPLDLASSDTSLEKSRPFFVVYNNGLDEEVHDLAIDWVQQNLVVPEPSALVLAIVGVVAIWMIPLGHARPNFNRA